MTLRPHLRVRISNPDRGEVLGRVEEVRAPQELPGISTAAPEAPEIEQVRAILHEADVDQVAFISYYRGRQQLLFAALHQRGAGTWRDLRGQVLTITDASESA